jgi:hypothetical protein
MQRRVGALVIVYTLVSTNKTQSLNNPFLFCHPSLDLLPDRDQGRGEREGGME